MIRFFKISQARIVNLQKRLLQMDSWFHFLYWETVKRCLAWIEAPVIFQRYMEFDL